MKVVVIHACALHPGYVGCYGNEWIETPNLDRLAAESIVFDQHYADNPASGIEGPGAGVRTCWTGRYQFPLPEGTLQTPEELPLLVRVLEEQGSVATQIISPSRPDPNDAEDATPLDRTLEAALEVLDKIDGRQRWLLWVDLPTLAPPWQVPEDALGRYFEEEPDSDEGPLTPWLDRSAGPLDVADAKALERLQNTYAATVVYFDALLGQFLEELEQRGLTDQVLFCLTADRGLALGEHGIVGDYRPWLHDELIHLPLIVRLPGGADAGRRVFALTQPVDLLPTLLEAFDLPAPERIHGRSLGPLLRGEVEQVRAYACSGMKIGDTIEWAMRSPEWGFILPLAAPADEPPRPPQLYVKPDDRWEVNDVRQHHLELAEYLEQTLREFVAATRRPGPLRPPELRDVEAERPDREPSGTAEAQP